MMLPMQLAEELAEEQQRRVQAKEDALVARASLEMSKARLHLSEQRRAEEERMVAAAMQDLLKQLGDLRILRQNLEKEGDKLLASFCPGASLASGQERGAGDAPSVANRGWKWSR